jgi:GT2 family glycosyltransferase
MSRITESIARIKALAKKPLSTEREKVRVEIIMLKFKESPDVIDKAISRIIHNTDWPFKLNIFDNRPLEGEENNRNTSKIWNFLVEQSTCNYVLIIDSDAYVPPTTDGPCWLTRMMEHINETGIVIPVSSAGGGAHQHVNGPMPYGTSQMNKEAWSGFCFLFSKGAYYQAGKFDERFYIYGQDSEWAIRVGKKLGGAVMREDVFVEHIGGASFKQDPIREDDKVYARELFKYLTK